MTLKPFLEDTLSMSSGTDGHTLQIHFSRPVTVDDRLALMEVHNYAVTRSAVPVEGLETVLWANRNAMKLAEKNFLWEVLVSNRENYPHYDHALVARSQAEAIIAAKDAEIERLQKINAMIMGDDENAPRYTTKRLKQEVERVTQVMRGEAADREAHVKTLQADNAAQTARVKELSALIDGENCADPDKIDALFRRAETAETQLAAARNALRKEKRLTDQLAKALEYIDDYSLSYPDLGVISAVSQPALEAHTAARAAWEAKP